MVFTKYRLPNDKNKTSLKKRLKPILGFKPKKINYYKKALIHKSFFYTLKSGKRINNERLEFLGDAILDAAVADFLFHRYSNKDEGTLSKLRSKIVKRDNLNEIALNLGIRRLMRCKIKNNAHTNLFGNALEALIGAIYIDRGFNKAKSFVIKQIINTFHDPEQLLTDDTDYKSQLIEWGQKNLIEVTFDNYEKGLGNKKEIIFGAKAVLGEKIMGEGTGKSKKEAEQNASRVALNKITEDN